MNLIKTVVLLCLSSQVLADCGEPGSSKSSPLLPKYLKPAQVYPENHKVWYNCQTAIIGPTYRICEMGKWTHYIPKCPTNFKATNLKVISSKGYIDVSWTEHEKVVGIQVGLRPLRVLDLSSLFLVSHVDAFDRFDIFSREGPKDGIKFRMLSVDKSDLQDYKPINRLVMNLTDESMTIASCDNNIESNYTYCLDKSYHKLFYIPEDYEDCDKPDAPLSASVVGVSNPNGDGIIAKYTCKPGYRMESNFGGNLTCLKHGDWTGSAIKPCQPVTCDPSSFIKTIRQFEPSQYSTHVSPGTIAILNCPGVSVNVTVICLESGQFTALPEYCLPEEKSKVTTVIVVSITMVIISVTLIIGVCCWHFKNKPAPVINPFPPDYRMDHRNSVNAYGTYDKPNDDYVYSLPDVPDNIADQYDDTCREII